MEILDCQTVLHARAVMEAIGRCIDSTTKPLPCPRRMFLDKIVHFVDITISLLWRVPPRVMSRFPAPCVPGLIFFGPASKSQMFGNGHTLSESPNRAMSISAARDRGDAVRIIFYQTSAVFGEQNPPISERCLKKGKFRDEQRTR
jgi:hypothetical protein